MSARRLLAAAAIVLALAGCDKLFSPGRSPFKGIDVTGAELGGEVRLTGHDMRPRALADFRGKVVVVAFGYANCPDVCPTTLADLAAAMKRLGDDASRVQVLFVTVDPKRDTPELLRQYVPAFDPSFLGLWGDQAATERVAKDFRVYTSVREGTAGETYTVDHSGQVFVFDREGRIRLVIAPGTPAESIAADLRILLNS